MSATSYLYNLMNKIMKKRFLSILALSMSLIALTSCNNDNDDNFRAFMSTATITGDSINGYFCYLDGGGLVISYDQSLKGIERGYFNFNYTENDWTTSPDGMKYINNAQVGAWSVYDVICPIDKNTFERTDDADKYNHQIPSLIGMSAGYRGYFDLNLGITTLNATNEKVRATLKLVYDPAEQNPDTLHLQLYYNPNIPDNWTNTKTDYGTVSCDISDLATLQAWHDSVTIVVNVDDKTKPWTKISKADFIKPCTLYTH